MLWMVKQSYKIPTNIDNSRLDTEIRFSTQDIESTPINLRSLIVYVLSGFGVFWVLSNTFMKQTPFFGKAVFVLAWGIMTYLLGRYEKTKELGYMKLIGLIRYMIKRHRKVATRLSDDAKAFAELINVRVREVETVGRKQTFLDLPNGWVGVMYRVSGSGSRMLFEGDRNVILTAVDNYFANVSIDASHTWVTTREPQKVAVQLDNVQKKIDEFDPVLDDDLLEKLETDKEVLEQVVGAQLKSIHHYLIIGGKNVDTLEIAVNGFIQEVERKGAMVQRAELLTFDEINEVFSKIYKGE